MIWKPRVTVAAVAEHNGRFLMVEEQVGGEMLFNQPAGHLEDDESLIDAVIRECLEETAWHFRPQALVGLYRWRSAHTGDTFLRATFCGECQHEDDGRSLDPDIAAIHWLSANDIRARGTRLRSPLVLRSLDDYLRGKRFPLELLVELDAEVSG